MDKNALYAIRFAGDAEYTGFAMDCQPRNKGDFDGIAYLTPPDRGHMIRGKVAEETGDGFKYMSTGYAPGEWHFQLITLENFRERFHRLVVGGDEIGRTANTTEELYEWFRREDGVL